MKGREVMRIVKPWTGVEPSVLIIVKLHYMGIIRTFNRISKFMDTLESLRTPYRPCIENV